MASEFVHTDPFFHKGIVLDGTAVADERAVLHMWTDTVRTTDSSATALTADGANPRNLLHTARTNPWVGWR
ncbi:hypothetical protein [Paenibacillus sp. P13VS]|uniref:hypothetical protein n=1 Tax=Paenibacillus sp. P13VS TaxID=2697367 RepID=UPI00187BB483|nr:hypothetical protein [Paenibacillus sp. P13VS]MBE7681641.1 hypothetical protein [Paenibacillus sp. P13VS]